MKAANTAIEQWKNNPVTVEGFQMTYLNALMTMFALIEELDALRSSTAYKQKIKNLSVALVKELEKEVNADLGMLWGTDDAAMYQHLNGKKTLLKILATKRTEHVSGLAALLEQYFNHPELTLHRNGIPIIQRSIDNLVKETANKKQHNHE